MIIFFAVQTNPSNTYFVHCECCVVRSKFYLHQFEIRYTNANIIMDLLNSKDIHTYVVCKLDCMLHQIIRGCVCNLLYQPTRISSMNVLIRKKTLIQTNTTTSKRLKSIGEEESGDEDMDNDTKNGRRNKTNNSWNFQRGATVP